jgi:dTDP-4-dehydrorhamnose 3,5-epimerase
VTFNETKLKGAFSIEINPIEDERGFFARTWCQNEFIEHGLNTILVQCNISFNKKKGTLRGMHYQCAPFEETKLVRCIKGAIFDVIIDIRPESKTYKQWFGIELTSENKNMLYVPKGFAHGFQTLVDETEVLYQMSEFYYPDYSRGIRWDDKAFDIKWPINNIIISDKDTSWGDF